MLDEVLYMQTRIFRMFLSRTGMSSKDANEAFKSSGAWDFIERCYDSLHMEGDECVYEDVVRVLHNGGVSA